MTEDKHIDSLQDDAESLAPTGWLTTADGHQLAYHQIKADPSKLSQIWPDANSPAPEFLFLAGHGSDMFGSKANALASWAEAHGFGCTRFDYFGHGLSDGAFLEGTISRWTDDAVQVLEACSNGPVILVGSSLGGWIMLNLAARLPARIAAMIGIAAAPEFTGTLIWDMLDTAQKSEMQETGQIALPNPYAEGDVIYPYHLVVDGRQNLRLTQPLHFDGPVILHQGMIDEEVPHQTAFDIAACLTSEQVEICLDKTAGHRFSGPAQLRALTQSAERILGRLIDRQPDDTRA